MGGDSSTNGNYESNLYLPSAKSSSWAETAVQIVLQVYLYSPAVKSSSCAETAVQKCHRGFLRPQNLPLSAIYRKFYDFS